MPRVEAVHALPFAIHIEEIMTPRSVLAVCSESDVRAAPGIAAEKGYEAVPILTGGRIKTFWSQSAGRIRPITRRHRVRHDDTVEWALSRLADHMIQFVYYRDEVVGLVDLSDLNKPLARLVVLRPLLELEQVIFLAVRARRIPDKEIASALGSDAARKAWALKRRAAREDLEVPLLEFVGFPSVLRAGSALDIVELTGSDVERLSRIRNRTAHAVLSLVDKRDDGAELIWVLQRCREIRNSALQRGSTSAGLLESRMPSCRA